VEEQESKVLAEESTKNGVTAPDSETKDEAALELPTDVRAKLRRLEKLEPRYHGM